VRGTEESGRCPLKTIIIATRDHCAKGAISTAPHSGFFFNRHDAWRARPENRTASSSIIRTAAPMRSSCSSSRGTVETIFGKQRYRAEDYIVIPRGITYQARARISRRGNYLILESSGPVRIPKRYLNQEGQIQNGSALSERDFTARLSSIQATRKERKSW